MPAPESESPGSRAFFIVILILSVLMWPVQAVILVALLTAVVALIATYNAWVQRHSFKKPQRRAFDRAVRIVTFVVLAFGAIAAVLVPRTTVLAVFGFAVLAAGLWAASSAFDWLRVPVRHEQLSGATARR